MKQLKISLPDDLRARLDDASEKSGNSLGEEVRQRLERSFQLDAFEARYDQMTRDFVAAVAEFAREVEMETGCAWHAHEGARLAFRQAILSRLARVKIEKQLTGTTTFGQRPHRTEPGDDPEHIGMWIEHHAHSIPKWSYDDLDRLRVFSEQTFREIAEAHQQILEKEEKGDG